jgi:hypothetical protein
MVACSTVDRRWLLATVAVTAVLAAIAALFLAGTVYSATEECRGGDPGRHYLEGQRIGLALRHFEIGSAASYLMDRYQWPPLQVVAIALVVAIGGADYRSASLISLVTWVVAVALIAGVAWRLWRIGRTTSRDTGWDRTAGLGAAILAAVWFGSTPLMLEYSFLPMQEVPSMMLLALALLVWLGMTRYRELGEFRNAARAARVLAVVTTLIGFTRYPVWVEWLLTWVVLEFATLSRQNWHNLARALRQFLFRRPAEGPSIWSIPALLLAAGFMALWVPTVILSRLSGGRIMIAGEQLRFGVGGNLVYAALVMAVIGTIHLWVRHRRWCRDLYGRLPDVWRAILVAHVAPMTVWFLLPPRLRLLVTTIFAPPGHHNVEYDLITLIRDDLFAAPWTALALAGLVVASLGLWRRTSATGKRFFWLALLILLATATFLSERRYALPALLPLILLASVTLARLLAETLPSFVRSRFDLEARGVGVGGAMTSIAAAVVMASSIGLSLDRVIGDGLPRSSFPLSGVVAAREGIVDAAGGRSGPLLVLTDDPLLDDTCIQAAFNDRHQRVLPDVVGWIQLKGRDADTALDDTLKALRPELIITYRASAALTPVDPERIAILEALERRTDYEIIETIPGANDGDVLELRAPVGARAAGPAG